ncbi:threonine/serine dehydratase [Kibdelosporangium lantanae]
MDPTLADVEAARERIRRYVRHTPIEYSPELSRTVGADVYLKIEALQVTGSFKPRISLNTLLTAKPGRVVASTAGGHGIGLSHAANVLGVPARIHLPRTADPTKVAMIRDEGADLVFADTVEDARQAALAEARETGALFVSAYNDPRVIAGGGTVGLEIAEDVPDADLVVTGMGGGGLACGLGIALPRATVWGVQPEAAPVLNAWLRAGRQVDVPTGPSVAEGLGGGIEPDSITFPLARRHVHITSEVSDEDIRHAVRWLAERHRLYIEPSGAAPVAALIRQPGSVARHRTVVLVLTGRNTSLRRWSDLVGDDAPAVRGVPTLDGGGTN